MPNVLVLNGNPTVGGTNGTLVTDQNPIKPGVLLGGADRETLPVKLAIRTAPRFRRQGPTVISPDGADWTRWALAPDDGGQPGPWGAWGDPLIIANQITETNQIFWVKARVTADEYIPVPRDELTVDLLVPDDAYELFAIGRSMLMRWSVYMPGGVGNSLDMLWNITTPVGKSLSLPYTVNTAVGKSLDLRWGSGGAVGKSLSLPWAITSPVGKSLSVPWNVIGPVGKSISLPWSILGPTTSEAILALSPLVYHDLQETSGTTFADKGANNVAATASGTPSVNQAGPKGGKSVYFSAGTGASGDRIATANQANLRFTNVTAHSFMAWINMDSVTDASGRMWIGQAEQISGNGYKGWSCQFLTDGRLYVARLNSSGSLPFYNESFSSSAFIQTGWHHYAVTYDGSNYRFYRDGALIDTVATTYNVQATNTQQFILGNDTAAAGVYDYPLKGYMAHSAVFAGALSLAQIQSVYNAS